MTANTMYPKVSVIIPNYNQAPYLRQRIDSVLQQTMGDFELILLDDCSGDDSRSIIDSYRNHPKVSHVVFNTENSGSTFVQWKHGLELAQGEYVWIAESDDFADNDFLATLVTQLDANPSAAMAFCGSHIVDKDGADIPGADWDKWPGHATETTTYTPYELVAKKLLRNCLIYNASMVVFRRNMAPEIKAQLSMRLCGDWLFWSEMARRGKGIEVRRKLNYFRQHQAKVSATAFKAGLTYVEGLSVVTGMADFLNLSAIQRKIIAGRLFKRLRKFPGLMTQHPQISRNLEMLSPGSTSNKRKLIAIYELDKIFHFSHLPAQQ